jgi:hypothetical protein
LLQAVHLAGTSSLKKQKPVAISSKRVSGTSKIDKKQQNNLMNNNCEKHPDLQ